jgi:D-alanyl-lipoteichoic acid acyltransferase DltB (MBOAT superfamily)
MVRCVANNYSTLGFWRSWHRSYNLWIVRLASWLNLQDYHSLTYRYIYIPLGGTKNVVLTTTLVFSFVALWHDLSFRLLAWGWLISLFIFPELLAAYFLPQTKVSRNHFLSDVPLFTHLVLARSVRASFMVSPCLRSWRCSQSLDDDFCKPCRVCDRHRWDDVYDQPDSGNVAR